jgi:hypothetical protein
MVMNDEERQKLIYQLYAMERFADASTYVVALCDKAAREIESLALELEISRKKETKFRREELKPMIISDD